MATVPESTQTQTSGPAGPKKLPGWAKLLIGVAILGVFLSALVGIGLTLLGNFLAGKGGEELAEEGIERLIEKGMEAGGAGDADIDVDKGQMVYRDRETGEQLAINTNQQIPAGFPNDIPIFSPSEVKGSVAMGPLTMVSLETTAPLADVTNYYGAQLPGQGWTATYVTPSGAPAFSGVYQKEGRQATVAVSLAGGGKTSIVLSYGTAPQPQAP